MSDITRILSRIESGDPQASAGLLPLVYEELRKLAAARMAHENPGQTLQATALVHDAYLRLVTSKNEPSWDSRGHFFAAASEAMRRILVDVARRKQAPKHGGDHQRQELVAEKITLPVPADELIKVHESLDGLEAVNPQAARLVKLRYFAGFTIEASAEQLGISPRKANQVWTYAKAWLAADLENGAGD